MSAILLDGAIVHYEVLGRGRPVIFLHGWIGSWRYWISSMQVASTSFRAYALDLWGYGDSAHESRRYNLEQQTALLDYFREALGIGKIALVGHGLGALIAASYATRSPDSVDRLMLINSPMDSSSLNSRLQSTSIEQLLEWLSSRTPEAQAALADAQKADPAALPASISGIPLDAIFERLYQQRIPCLLVYGMNDPTLNIPREKLLSLPHFLHHITLENSGHFPMIDETARFNRLLTVFLALDSGISPKELQLKEEWKRRVR